MPFNRLAMIASFVSPTLAYDAPCSTAITLVNIVDLIAFSVPGSLPFRPATRSTAVAVSLSGRDRCHQADGLGIGATVATTGGHRLQRCSRRQLCLNQRGHPRREGDADVHLGKAVVTAVGPHDPKVMGDTEVWSRAECMAVDRGDGGNRCDQHARKQFLYLGDIPVGLISVRGKPIQVEPVGVELGGSGGDQRLGVARLDSVEKAVDVGQPFREKRFSSSPRFKLLPRR